MLSVTIRINEQVVFHRSVSRRYDPLDKNGEYTYDCDDGRVIKHNPDDGAVKLAQKVIAGIKEQGVEQ